MIKTITKQECQMAMLVEPLEHGEWNRWSNDKCSVCAVGAVFRQLGINSQIDIAKLMSGKIVACDWEIDFHLDNKNYLAALSCYFEGVLEYGKTKITNKRWALVDFIEAFFPDVLEVEV